jgi:hypothetical protein
MFSVPTVFVVGAGAGVDVDMPTGEMLCNEIAKKVNLAFESGTKKISGDDRALDAIRRISKEQQIDGNRLMAAGRQISKGIHLSGSIDSYIHTHKDDELIKIVGKLGIVQTILEYEKKSKLFVNSTKHPFVFRDETGVMKSWFRNFMILLQEGIIAKHNLDSIFKNVMIINFNYDRCVEQFLYRAFQSLFGIDGSRAAELIGKLRIYHPYGMVAPLPWQPSGGVEFGGNPYGEDDYGKLIGNIRTFNEEVEEGMELRMFQEIFAASKGFVFLGFHFHKQNLELITPRAMQMNAEIEIYATALNRSASDIEVISQRMGQVFGVNVTYARRHYEMHMDCGKLFADFGSKFVSP